jgi:hypothetical protein
MLKPLQLPLDKLAAFLPTITNSSLECVSDGGESYWVVDDDDDGVRVLNGLAALTEFNEIGPGKDPETLTMLSGNTPEQFWYAATLAGHERAVQELSLFHSISWNPVRGRKSALYVTSEPSETAFDTVGLSLVGDDFG